MEPWSDAGASPEEGGGHGGGGCGQIISGC